MKAWRSLSRCFFVLCQALMLRGEAELAEPWAKQMVLGLGLLFLGKQGAVEATVEVRGPIKLDIICPTCVQTCYVIS